jgi:hypothetical protein
MDIHIPTWALWVATFVAGWACGLIHAAFDRATR